MDKKDFKKLTGFTKLGILFAAIAPFVGWAQSGFNDMGMYFKHAPERAFVWAMVGMAIGNVITVFLEKQESANKKEEEKESRNDN